MIPASQAAPVIPRSACSSQAGLWPAFRGTWDVLLTTSAIVVRHRFGAPWAEGEKVDRRDR